MSLDLTFHLLHRRRAVLVRAVPELDTVVIVGVHVEIEDVFEMLHVMLCIHVHGHAAVAHLHVSVTHLSLLIAN